MLWGDSTAEHLAPILEPIAKERNVSVFLYGYCPAILSDQLTAAKSDEPNYANVCPKQRAIALEALKTVKVIDTVILAASWKLLEFNIISQSGFDGKRAMLAKGLAELLSELMPLGKRIVIADSFPIWPSDPIPCAIVDTSVRSNCPEEKSKIQISFLTRFRR